MAQIDVHHHILPPKFVKAWNEKPAVSQGMKLPLWSPNHSLRFMEENGISTSILSLGAPTTSMGKGRAEINLFCRETNEYTASLRDAYQSQFGFFATVPSLEDVGACIEEIRYSLRELKADGINLLTSYGGKYLGHPDFRKVWDELEEHDAVVFVHPSLEGTGGIIKEPRPLPPPIFDWTHETTRTAVHLITTDMFRTHRRCRIILSHGGGTLPYTANRIAHLSEEFQLMDKSAEDFLEEARSFYFDIAFTGYQEPIELLLKFAHPGHVMYGSDYPFGRGGMITAQLRNIDRFLEPRTDAALIRRDAALALFPRFQDVK